MIKDNILKIKGRVKSVCSKINIDPNSIIIVCVSKNRTVEQIKEVISLGLTNIGENRVQEAVLKYNAIRNSAKRSEASPEGTQYAQRIKWHMIGHLQTNKAKEAVGIFDLIHSVDSRHLAEEINKQAAKINKTQDALIEVNVSGEASKFGVRPDEAVGLIKEISGLKNISVKGLMTIAPMADSPESARPYFKALRELKDHICELRFANCDLRILSMGMTDDFEIAIEEGATMVRIGRAIFGK
ncbi:MAG: YggS family pyridoxal phosphate-dependent enzyme [Candidatus Omnitrophota bacterium]